MACSGLAPDSSQGLLLMGLTDHMRCGRLDLCVPRWDVCKGLHLLPLSLTPCSLLMELSSVASACFPYFGSEAVAPGHLALSLAQMPPPVPFVNTLYSLKAQRAFLTVQQCSGLFLISVLRSHCWWSSAAIVLGMETGSKHPPAVLSLGHPSRVLATMFCGIWLLSYLELFWSRRALGVTHSQNFLSECCWSSLYCYSFRNKAR